MNKKRKVSEMKKNYSEPMIKVQTIALKTFMQSGSETIPISDKPSGEDGLSKDHLLDGLFD